MRCGEVDALQSANRPYSNAAREYNNICPTILTSKGMVSATPDITDIRSSTVVDLRESILEGLKQGPPSLPTLILYDERGLKLFEKITFLDEYYLTNCELSILKSKSDEIVKRLGLQNGGIVVELGSG